MTVAAINIRKTHPGLYHLIMILCLMRIGLALNFWFSRPTFDPFHISNNLIGWIFFTLGVCQLVFLNVLRDLRLVRITMAISTSVMLFWGLANTQQSFAGEASFQLPILYVTLAFIQIPLLIESPVNPMTEKR